MVRANYHGGKLCLRAMAMPVEAREDLARALTATIFGVMQRMKQDSARKAADWDMSVAQVRALYALREPLSMRELAEQLYLDPSNLTALVDHLEDLGLVQRQADADDRRVKRLVITEKGVHLSEEIIDAVFAEGTVFDVLDAHEQRQLLDLLGKMVGTPTA
jgi:MarR family transcriptional regulator, organic hydroperoxide resistance regulator